MQDQKFTDRSAFLLQALAEAGRATPGTELFPHLVRSLATALGLRYCLLTECLDSPASKVRTLAFWDGERIRDNFEYDLAGTPCRRVLGGAECRIGDGVRALFPDDPDLVDLAAESYAALPLLNTWGQVTGHLAVLHTRPFAAEEPDLTLMRFCAARAGSELERMRLNERLVRAHRLEMVGQLAGGLVHDFNNVLTVIAGYAELLLSRLPAEDERRVDGEEILAAAHRGRRLVEQLAVVQKQPSAPPRPFELNALLDELGPRLRRVLGDDLHLEPAPAAQVFADPAQIELVLLTLLSHIRDGLSADGRLSIATSLVELDAGSPWLEAGLPSGAYVACRLDDGSTGTGVASIGGRHPFAPAFTHDDAATKHRLATVFGIVREAGGHLAAEATTLDGTRFTMLLPRIDPHAGSESERLGAARGETLLVVEDRAEVRRLLERMLARGGYEVLSASDPEQALALGREHLDHIALLITDILLPGGDGWELGRRWREHRPCARILYISGSFDDAMVEANRTAGACDFLRKPFSSQKLLEKVGEILASGVRGSQTAGVSPTAPCG